VRAGGFLRGTVPLVEYWPDPAQNLLDDLVRGSFEIPPLPSPQVQSTGLIAPNNPLSFCTGIAEEHGKTLPSRKVSSRRDRQHDWHPCDAIEASGRDYKNWALALLLMS
jgi:hypothetical protein